MPKILIVEDDPQIVQAIEKTLSLEKGFVASAVSNPRDVLRAAIEYGPDLILLDIQLPGGDGRILIKDLKANASTHAIPVIFLTGYAREGDKVLGFDLGAEDYVTKPFGAIELMARIKNVLRRRSLDALDGRIIEIQGLRLDPLNRAATIDGTPLKLQPKEFEILFLLAAHPRRTLTRTYLIENSSSYGLPISTRSLDTHIKNIRKKLGGKSRLIETVSKMGYAFCPSDDPA